MKDNSSNKVSTLINHNDYEGQPLETIRHVLARDHPRPSTREDLRRSRSTLLGQTGLRTDVFGIMLCYFQCFISPVV